MAISMSSGPMPAILYARPAERLADVAVKSFISSMLAWSIASPEPAIHTGFVLRLFATAAEVTSTAPPWSQTRQQSSRFNGHEITREFSTSSTVIGPPKG